MNANASSSFTAFLRLALWRSLRTLAQGEVIGALIWPILVAAVLWFVIGLLAWWPLQEGLLAWLEAQNAVTAEETTASWWLGVLLFAVKLLLLLGMLPLVYVTALVLVSVWTLPGLIRRIAQRDYPMLEFRHGVSVAASLSNTLLASLWYLLGLAATVLLWWLPGALVVLPFLLTAWLHRRTFVLDCLAEVASGEEIAAIQSRYGGWLLAVGAIGAALFFVPLLNLAAPVLVGVLFAHATLELLRRERGLCNQTWELLP